MAEFLLVHCVALALLCLVCADQEHVQHGGHVHTQHEVGGQHNVEFDHEAILGKIIHLLDYVIFNLWCIMSLQNRPQK